MDHQQLATRMVCSWGLVKAYQWTRQSTYVCPPAPHVIEAFNHKVNHDSHKELGTQEHVVLQYAHALQYVSFCNDERYKDYLAPVVKAFWSEVAEPFGSRALCNLVIDTVYPNIPLSSASLHGHPRSSVGATLGVRMSMTAYGNLSTVSCVWPIGTSRLNLRPHPLSI